MWGGSVGEQVWGTWGTEFGEKRIIWVREREAGSVGESARGVRRVTHRLQVVV